MLGQRLGAESRCTTTEIQDGLDVDPDQRALLPSPARTDDLYFQVPDFLAQRVAIDAQQVGSPDLVAAGRGKCRREQGVFDLPQDSMIEARRRQAIGKAAEILVEIALDRGRQVLLGAAFLPDPRWRRRRPLGVDDSACQWSPQVN